MTITRKDITPQPAAPPKTEPERLVQAHRWELGLMLLAFALPWWAAGAKYTIDGAIWALNWFLVWLGTPAVVTRPANPWLYLLLIGVVGWLFSRVEVKHLPIKRTKDRWKLAPPMVWVGFGLVAGADLGTTYLGVVNPVPDAWALSAWLAATPWAAAVWIGTTTFLPEHMIRAGWRYLRG